MLSPKVKNPGLEDLALILPQRGLRTEDNEIQFQKLNGVPQSALTNPQSCCASTLKPLGMPNGKAIDP
jgi:hypothetical protein